MNQDHLAGFPLTFLGLYQRDNGIDTIEILSFSLCVFIIFLKKDSWTLLAKTTQSTTGIEQRTQKGLGMPGIGRKRSGPFSDLELLSGLGLQPQ
jgi:hypothetical protein